MSLPSSVKGTKDLFDIQSQIYQYITQTALQVGKTFGLQYIELPIIEHLQLFIRGIGEETDVVSKELFSWEDKGGRALCLRPEGTAQTVRFVLEQGQLRNGYNRYLYIGSMFRAEKPQKGRQREFHQIGVEIFGDNNPLCDVETIHFAISLLNSLGVKEYHLTINSVGCDDCRPEYIRILKSYFLENQSHLCKSCQNRIEKNPLRALDCKEESCQTLLNQAPSILDFLCQTCKEHFDFVKYGLELLETPFHINHRLVRGLDYYTQTAFEITLPDLLGAQDAVCGGGRYNNLVKTLSDKEDSPAVGLAIGVERLMIALENLKHPILQKQSFVDILVLSEKQYLKDIFQKASTLREKGIALYFDIQERAVGKKISKAVKLGAKWVIIVGEDEVRSDLYTLKNLVTSEQFQCSWQNLELKVLEQ